MADKWILDLYNVGAQEIELTGIVTNDCQKAFILPLVSSLEIDEILEASRELDSLFLRATVYRCVG